MRSMREVLYPRGFAGRYVLQPWLAWPRVARPYACRSCGATYSAALHPDVEVTRENRVTMEPYQLEVSWSDTPLTGMALAGYNPHAFCRSADCPRFYAYDEEPSRLDAAVKKGERWPPRPRGLMRRRWLPMPAAANGAMYQPGR